MTDGPESPFERLAALSPAERSRAINAEARKHGLDPDRLKAMMLGSWRFTGRPKQQAPAGDWVFWFILAGRGFGKTLSAAQWTKERAMERRCRIGLIAPIRADVRATMVEGESGLLSVIPNAALFGQSRDHAWNKTELELTLANGTIIKGFSSERPDRLRGPEHDYIWCEEVSSWQDANQEPNVDHTTWSNMQMTIRAAAHPQVVLTSTPKPNRLTRALVKMAAPTMRIVRGSSYENRSNLSQVWWDEIIAPIMGTRTGRQEIEAELLEDVEGALWTKAMIEATRVSEYPPLMRIVVGVDPNTTSGETADAAGIIVAGLGFKDKHVYVLQDRTQERGGPPAWSQAAVDAYHDWHADKVVVEVNNGGEMCQMVIQGVDQSVPVKMVTASRGKRTRAEPVSNLYEGLANEETGEWIRAPRIHHVGSAEEFSDLEDEMTTWTPEEESPNRMDALVWAVTELKPWKPPSALRGSHRPTGDIPGVASGGRGW